MTTASPVPRPWLVAVALGAILLVHAAVALWAAAGKSVTADEILYVTGGYYIDRYGDYRIQPENGVLPQRLHGLAGILTGAPTPTLQENPYWRTSANLVNSYQFFYETGHDHFPMLLWARGLNTLFSIGTGLLVFWWARRFAGASAGLIAAALYAADPNVLAHAALATSDLAAVCLLLASVTAFWRQLETPRAGRIVVSAICFGLACVSKYSAALLLPIFAAMAIGNRLLQPAPKSHVGRRWLTIIVVHGLVAWATIWTFHGFRYSGYSPLLPAADHYLSPWERVLPFLGWQAGLVEFARAWHLLPEPYLYGYAFVRHASLARAAFLAGTYSNFGWAAFFPLAFVWKSTPGLLVGVVCSVTAVSLRWSRPTRCIRSDLHRIWPLLTLAGVYALVAITSKLNIGHRHILPIYPVLYIAVGVWLARLSAPRHWRLMAMSIVLAAQAGSAIAIAPHFLSYFNRLSGGPEQGYRLLVDSSLDWGQDLPALRDWLKTNEGDLGEAAVFLSYFGSGEPAYYQIRATRLPFINGFKLPQRWYELNPGVYAISATMLQQVYSGFGGTWTAEMESEYHRLRRAEPAFRSYHNDPGARAELLREADARTWEENWRRFEALRFARLCAHLRTRQPDATAGYSILIYRVDAAELSAAVN